jgi:hypothetical protein
VALFAVAFFAVAFFAVAFFAVALFAVAFLAVVRFAVVRFAVVRFAVVRFAGTVYLPSDVVPSCPLITSLMSASGQEARRPCRGPIREGNPQTERPTFDRPPEWCTGISVWLVYLFVELKTGARSPHWFCSPCGHRSRLP